MSTIVTQADNNQPADKQSPATPFKDAGYGDQYLHISAWKVLFMCFVPFYGLVWVWRNWRIYRARQQSSGGVLWRTAFWYLMMYPLLKDMFSLSPRAKKTAAVFTILWWSTYVLSIVLFFLNIHSLVWTLSQIFILTAFKALIQSKVNEFALKPANKKDGFKCQFMTCWNYVGVVFGLAWFLVSMIAVSFSSSPYLQSAIAKRSIKSWTHYSHFSSLNLKVRTEGPAVFCAISQPVVLADNSLVTIKSNCHPVMKPIIKKCMSVVAAPTTKDTLNQAQATSWTKQVMQCSMAHYFINNFQYHSRYVLAVAEKGDIAKHCASGSKACIAKRKQKINVCYQDLVKKSKIPNQLSYEALDIYIDKVSSCAQGA